MVVGQKIALGRIHKHQTVTVPVSGTTLAIEFGDRDTRVIRRITTQQVGSIKGQRPRTAAYLLLCLRALSSPRGLVSLIPCCAAHFDRRSPMARPGSSR
jgi:hypothetical protein